MIELLSTSMLPSDLPNPAFDVEVELGAQRGVEVRPRVEPVRLPRMEHLVRHRHVQRVVVEVDIVLRHLDRAVLVIQVRADVEPNRVVPAAHVRAVQAASCRGE